MGVITPKYKKNIIIGEVILLIKIPNLNQIIFGLINIFLKYTADIKKNRDIKNDPAERNMFLS